MKHDKYETTYQSNEIAKKIGLEYSEKPFTSKWKKEM